jgi:adenosylcobinamide kinase/adenosylcobinamide-phosphate guanylyltransferase
MALTVLLGGARSGKSELAVALAARAAAPVSFVATGEALDQEFSERIARHRERRPAHWRTVEEPVALVETLGHIDPDDTVILDCLTLWVANLFERGASEAAIFTAAEEVSGIAAARRGLTVVVSNEVGSGIVPLAAATRAYRDALGRVNATFATRAERALLVVAGRALHLADPLELLAGDAPGRG